MSKPIYRPLFLEAWKKTWQHKPLWLAGIFATAMISGGLFESLSGNWHTALKGRIMLEQCLNGALPGFQWLTTYSRYLAELEPVQQYFLSTVIVFILLFVLAVGVISQGIILVSNLNTTKDDLLILIKKSYRHFWRILGLDFLGKLALIILFLITVAPVAFLNPLPYGWHQYPPFISMALFLAGTIFITAWQMLALVGVVRRHLNIIGALLEAWHIFRFHFLVTLELGLLLFAASLLATVILTVVLFILAGPLFLLFIAATHFSSPEFYLFAVFFSLLTIVATILLASGIITTFQYTVWSLYFEEAGRFGIVSKIKRWFKF